MHKMHNITNVSEATYIFLCFWMPISTSDVSAHRYAVKIDIAFQDPLDDFGRSMSLH